MATDHHYALHLSWTGNRGPGTRDYRAYGRDHVVRIAGKPDLALSSDPDFRGDPARHNPEDLLLASLAACHMLWYLHLAAEAGIVVTAYEDRAEATMTTDHTGGRFVEAVLAPRVTIAAGDPAVAEALHATASARCFIARSVNFPVRHRPEIVSGKSD
jgi:organic hydroperoxide reductase OsmC/OhrA